MPGGIVKPEDFGQPELFFTVEDGEYGQRLDAFLSRRYVELSRSHLKRLIVDGAVLVNGREVKPSYEVRPEDGVALRLPCEDPETKLVPRAMPLDILYEDDDIIVIDKAAGIVVHPGAGHEEGTLVHGLLAHCPRLAVQGAPLRPGIVHRLDRDTSGAMVVAKTESAYLDLVRQFREHIVRKEYLALVYGRLPQSEGEIRTLLDRHAENRKKMAVVEGRGREAVSLWKVERELGEVTLLRVGIETGRTHQIRVHMSHLHHPVVGDETYGGGKRRLGSIKAKNQRDVLEKATRQLLHAHRLWFHHPATGLPVDVVSPLAPDFAEILRELDEIARFGDGPAISPQLPDIRPCP